MTIRDLHNAARQGTCILIAWGDDVRELQRNNALEVDAYGPYAIDYLEAIDTHVIEAGIKMLPVKEGHQ